jgi:hypothetical protein
MDNYLPVNRGSPRRHATAIIATATMPQAPIVKYGMPAEYVGRVVERHFGVLHEEQLIHALHMAHNMRVAPVLSAALNRASPPSAPVPAMPVQAVPELANIEATDLRAQLGLS